MIFPAFKIAMRKTIKKRTALLLAVFLLVFSVSGCGKSNAEVKALISRFESACQKLDADEMLSCFNPRVTSPIRSVLGILGVDTLNDIVSTLADVWGFIDFKNATPKDVLKTIQIQPQKYTDSESGQECNVQATIKYSNNNKDVESKVIISCVKGSDGWYISGIKAEK